MKKIKNQIIAKMKKVVMTVAALAIGLIAAPLQAADGPKFNVAAIKNAEKALFTCQHSGREKLTLRIKDQAGNVVHQETIAYSIARVYDLSHLGKGTYHFELAGKEGVSVKTIQIRGKETSPLVMQVTEGAKRGLFHLAYFQNFAKEKVEIRITNEKGEEVYTGYATDEDYYRFFDLSQLPSGNYTFTLTCGEQILSQTVRIAR